MYGRQHVQDIPRPGRPCRATTDENVRKVDGVNWRITIGEVAEELGIDMGEFTRSPTIFVGIGKCQHGGFPAHTHRTTLRNQPGTSCSFP
ncbi:hypothetical protein TNCT_203831 [Trichonephila clavata]|uniref:Uncharacterized protein n=1 Tax=Trichonephila clavata TaxID=2740835 RepID=A0A8X6G626_TRICU|nr:hypothetical protein TNCT_203831 [Trichonephila clavata]